MRQKVASWASKIVIWRSEPRVQTVRKTGVPVRTKPGLTDNKTALQNPRGLYIIPNYESPIPLVCRWKPSSGKKKSPKRLEPVSP